MKNLKWLESIFRSANILLIIATLLAYMAPYINPNSIWILAIFGLAYPVLLVLNIAFIGFWSLVKNRLWMLSFACILLGISHFNAIVGIGFTSEPPAIKHRLKVMSYNVRNFKVGKHTFPERIALAKKMLAVPKIKEFDIFCGQEFTYPAGSKDLTNTLNPLFKTNYQHATNQKGLLIISKYPIINKSEVILQDSISKLNSCLFADIQIDNNTIVRVYNLHLSSNKVSGTTEKMKIDSEEIQTKGFWKKVKSVLRSYRDASQIRADQALIIAEHIKGSPYPVILCGDFNDPPVSYAYYNLSENLQDTFCEAGTGLGTTYAGNIPLLRIDYIFADQRLTVLNYKKLEIHHSDHFPIISELGFVN